MNQGQALVYERGVEVMMQRDYKLRRGMRYTKHVPRVTLDVRRLALEMYDAINKCGRTRRAVAAEMGVLESTLFRLIMEERVPNVNTYLSCVAWLRGGREYGWQQGILPPYGKARR